MKFSNRLLLFLAGVVFVLLGLFLFTNPVANLVAYSWWISFGLLVSSIAAILGYFSAPKELRSPVYLFQGFVNLLLSLYLVAYGFVTLPVVIPTIVGIWLIVEAIIAFFKGNRLGLIFPIGCATLRTHFYPCISRSSLVLSDHRNIGRVDVYRKFLQCCSGLPHRYSRNVPASIRRLFVY